jgi:hypothetical protein
MKKLIGLGLVMLLCGVMIAGADDAKVMPMRVGRIYLAPSFAFAPGRFNDDGEYKSYESDKGALKALNLGFALEYGVIDWITAAVQWAPGVNAWSDVDTKLGASDEVNANGVADLFMGAKIQIIGEKAPVKNEMFRFAIGPGVKIPLPGPDYEEQLKNAVKGNPVTAANVDKHVFGVGSRIYFDYQIHESFFLNLYGEFIGYPVKGKLEDSGLQGAGVLNNDTIKGTISSTLGALGADPTLASLATQFGALLAKYDKNIAETDGGVDYGYDLTLELEPVYSTSLAEGIIFTGGLPFNYKFTPAAKYDKVKLTDDFRNTVKGAVTQAAPNFAPMVDGMFLDPVESGLNDTLKDEDSHIFTIKPNISFFFTGWFLPTDLKLQYSIPLTGKNAMATHTLTFIAKIYLKI